jgi:hypothetical protein
LGVHGWLSGSKDGIGDPWAVLGIEGWCWESMDGFGINGRFWDQLVLFVHWDHGVVRVRMLQATKQALEQATVLIMRYLGIEDLQCPIFWWSTLSIWCGWLWSQWITLGSIFGIGLASGDNGWFWDQWGASGSMVGFRDDGRHREPTDGSGIHGRLWYEWTVLGLNR